MGWRLIKKQSWKYFYQGKKTYLAVRLPVFLVLETLAAFSTSTSSSEASSSLKKKEKDNVKKKANHLQKTFLPTLYLCL